MIPKTDFLFANRVNCPCKYNFSDDGKKVTPRRDVPNYPKVCCRMMPLEGIPWSSRVSADCPPPRTVHAVSGDGRGPQEADIRRLALGTQRGSMTDADSSHATFRSVHPFLPLWLQMLSCLEYMYHDLGLVKEFNMNPITLKRWLVTSERQRRTRGRALSVA